MTKTERLAMDIRTAIRCTPARAIEAACAIMAATRGKLTTQVARLAKAIAGLKGFRVAMVGGKAKIYWRDSVSEVVMLSFGGRFA